MSGASEVPADVQALALKIVRHCQNTPVLEASKIVGSILRQHIGPLARPVDTGREKALEEAIAIVERQPFYPDTHTGTRQQWVKDEIVRQIRAIRDVPTAHTPSIEGRKDRERQIRVSEYRRAVEWLHGRAKAMNDRHARAVLDLAGDEYGRSRARALANPENGRG